MITSFTQNYVAPNIRFNIDTMQIKSARTFLQYIINKSLIPMYYNVKYGNCLLPELPKQRRN